MFGHVENLWRRRHWTPLYHIVETKVAKRRCQPAKMSYVPPVHVHVAGPGTVCPQPPSVRELDSVGNVRRDRTIASSLFQTTPDCGDEGRLRAGYLGDSTKAENGLDEGRSMDQHHAFYLEVRYLQGHMINSSLHVEYALR